MIPARRKPPRSGIERAPSRECAAHRKWVRGHACSVPGCERRDIECAHVRRGTDAGVGIKPSDRWTIPLCAEHHREQHSIGEASFERRHRIDMKRIAEALFARSPHRHKLTCELVRR